MDAHHRRTVSRIRYPGHIHSSGSAIAKQVELTQAVADEERYLRHFDVLDGPTVLTRRRPTPLEIPHFTSLLVAKRSFPGQYLS
jgi:hypothetical protein